MLCCCILEIIDAQGKEFEIAFLMNWVEEADKRNPTLELFVTPASDSTTAIFRTEYYDSSNQLQSDQYSVFGGQVKKVTLPSSLRMDRITGISRKAVHVNSSSDIIIYALNKDAFSTDGFLCLPTDAMGSQYYTVSYSTPRYKTQFAVTPVEDNTDVEITLPNRNGVLVRFDNGEEYSAGAKISRTLNKHDVLQVQQANEGDGSGDLTGTLISSNKNVAVFSGNERTSVPSSRPARDHLAEMMVPVQSWGKIFVSVPTPGRDPAVYGDNTDVFRYVASADNTQIVRYCTSKPTTSIDDGETKTFTISNAGGVADDEVSLYRVCRFVADKPVMIQQVVKSQISNEMADPAMITLVPVEQYAKDYHFALPVSASVNEGGTPYTHYLEIVIEKQYRNSLVLDGTEFSNLTLDMEWTDVPADPNDPSGVTYVAGVVKVTNEDISHVIFHPTPSVTFGVVMYGAGDKETYGFPMGMKLKIINPVRYLHHCCLVSKY